MSLITVNVAVFVWVIASSASSGALASTVTDMHLRFGLSRQVLAQPIAWQGDGSVFVTQPDEWYRLVTSGFLHFGIIHLAFNMYFLYVLGPMLEPGLGRVRFLLLYVASLLGGSLGVVMLDGGTGVTAGASGAVFGLLAAAAVGLWQRGVNPLSTGIGTTLVLNLFITFAVPGISIGGHLGGAAAGALCGLVMLAPAYRRFPRWATYAAPVIIGLGSVVASVLVVNTA